jgi:TRAP-type uncharacterized transport system substrate-binding protein
MFIAAVPAFGLGLTTSRARAQTTQKPMLCIVGQREWNYRFVKEFDQAAPGLIMNTQSDASLTNIDRVMDNQAELGVTQLDALVVRAFKETNLRERIRGLAILHIEEVYFIAKSASQGSLGTPLFKPCPLTSVDDLRGQRLGFWGGAVITEQVISAMTLIGWSPEEYPDQTAALAALKDDNTQAILAVGGLSVRAMLVTRNYTSKGKHDQLQMIHDRLADVVVDIRETRGTHPKWDEVDPVAVTDKWPMYLSAKG